MDVVFKNDDKEIYLKNNGVIFLCGANQSGKTHILNILRDGFNSKYKQFSINNLNVNKDDYNVLYYDDTTDFDNVFKFTKTNAIRDLIYTNVLNNINETKLLKEVNELFDKIDVKVNKYLDININKKQDEKVVFDIDIDNINTIVDKFTNIYVNNYLMNEDEIPRSIKRKLIYNLMFFELNKSDKDNIVLIDNFDLYLDYENINKIINELEDYHKRNKNTYFFITTNNNIYDLIDDKSSIYHIANGNVNHIDNIRNIIEEVLINLNEKDSIIDELEVNRLEQEINNYYLLDIGKFYVNNNVIIARKISKASVSVLAKNKFYEEFFKIISEKLNE